MGNEGSQLVGLEIDNESVEVTENWSLHLATLSTGNTPQLSIFISQLFSGGSKTGTPPLTQASKNLMLHRHPCILRYISSWSKGGRYHLATEQVTPLTQVLANQTPLQICLGLHSILKALVFLHEKALSSHNNICRAAIYVTPDGTWKLGGFEYLCRFTELTPVHLQQTRAHRYEQAVPPEEDSTKASNAPVPPTAVDQFAFGVLVEEVLRQRMEEDMPSLPEFLDLARKHLQSSEPSLRPQLESLFRHAFFAHDFIKVHSFLLELPLKTDAEKQTFFRCLPAQLRGFPEEVVATQLGSLLLARVVLLDAYAQEHLLPDLLHPRTDSGGGLGLFSLDTYRAHLVPRLLQMFCVRDAQIRLLLLSHFRFFCRAFSPEQLRTLILPELLVGVKDSSDHLVSVTLRALADLVPVLGAATVIGGKRGKLFTDGRPKVRGPGKEQHPSSIAGAPAAPAPDADSISFEARLPERPSPDGGEDLLATTDEDTEAWSDWDLAENNANHHDSPVVIDAESEGSLPQLPDLSSVTVQSLPDIASLDIKSMATSQVVGTKEEFDFFQDMEPVISKPQVVQIEDDSAVKVSNSRNLFEVNSLTSESWEDGEAEGWGDDLGDWGMDAEIETTKDINAAGDKKENAS